MQIYPSEHYPVILMFNGHQQVVNLTPGRLKDDLEMKLEPGGGVFIASHVRASPSHAVRGASSNPVQGSRSRLHMHRSTQ